MSNELVNPPAASVPAPSERAAPARARPEALPLWDLAVYRVRQFYQLHGHRLWWVHSAYALFLGGFVAAFAQKGFAHARWLVLSLGLAWLLVVLFFRFFGTGARAQAMAMADRSGRIRFLVMTYVLKNLYQGMLFFLLPFYWKSTSFDASNRWFFVVLSVCALLSTLDVVFDRFLMRWRHVASVFYAVTLFACANLVIPAFVLHARTLSSLMAAAAITVVAFWTLHLPMSALRNRLVPVLVALSIAAGIGLAYAARRAIPPVPMHLLHGAVGPALLPDGRLAMEVSSVDASVVQQLHAVTDVVIPSGRGDRLFHVWRHDGAVVWRRRDTSAGSTGEGHTIRLRSDVSARDLPARLAGRWSVDVETEDGQLVGRVSFMVTGGSTASSPTAGDGISTPATR